LNLKRNILIVGVNGNIGVKLHSILSRLFSIYSISSNYGTIEDNFTKLDLNDKNALSQYGINCPHYDILIFLVGLAHKKGKGAEYPAFKKINYQTLENLLSELKRNNKIPEKIIFSSTISTYGEKYYQDIYTEDLINMPLSPYAITKLEAEQYLLDKFSDKTWILRFAPVYSSDFLLNINRRTRIGRIFYRVGKGDKKLSLCNIENIGTAIEKIIYDKVPKGIYNISDPNEYSYNELLHWRKANLVFPIPVFTVKFLYYVGKFLNNKFLIENTIKLITDNIFPSKKICSFIDLPATINDLKFDNGS